MTQTSTTPRQETLADLRVDIDRIDGEVHALLMERGTIIDRLIAIKARQGGGSAFRPAREASMMRAIAERHRGRLPLDTVESIWRIIISTFTYVQAHYSVHADIGAGDAAMRDSVRFHFGFTVPFCTCEGPQAVIAAVAASQGDLGMVRLEAGAPAGAWWQGLCAPGAPKIIARLPFVERPDHPAGMPVFVIAQPLAEAAARDVVVHVATFERWRNSAPAAIVGLGGEIIGNAADGIGLSLMIALPGTVTAKELHTILSLAGAPPVSLAEAGSHAARFEYAARYSAAG